MSEHVHLGAPAPAVMNAPTKVERPEKEAPRIFKRRIDCEEPQRAAPAREQRKGRGGRRRTDTLTG